MKLTADQKKKYRTLGHQLKPVVTVAGKGLTESVKLEVNRALEDHELIKIKFAISERTAKKQLITELCDMTNAELVQAIGHIVLLYRKTKNPDPKLSNLIRTIKK